MTKECFRTTVLCISFASNVPQLPCLRSGTVTTQRAEQRMNEQRAHDWSAVWDCT